MEDENTVEWDYVARPVYTQVKTLPIYKGMHGYKTVTSPKGIKMHFKCLDCSDTGFEVKYGLVRVCKCGASPIVKGMLENAPKLTGIRFANELHMESMRFPLHQGDYGWEDAPYEMAVIYRKEDDVPAPGNEE